MSIRDTQFQGFAKALVEEMCNQTQGGWIDFDIYDKEEVEKYSLVVARRAYDLAMHIAHHVNVCGYDLENKFWTDREIVADVPDLTELPKGAR